MDGTKILVVDNDAELRDLPYEHLIQQDFAVSVLHDGGGPAAQLERERLVLAVLGLIMPKIGGLPALCDLRAHNDGVLVILLTTHSGEVGRTIGLGIGVDDYLGRPLSSCELLVRVSAMLY